MPADDVSLLGGIDSIATSSSSIDTAPLPSSSTSTDQHIQHDGSDIVPPNLAADVALMVEVLGEVIRHELHLLVSLMWDRLKVCCLLRAAVMQQTQCEM